MKKFNLEEALSGTPVKLRNGKKAYVIGRVPDGINIDYHLLGFCFTTNPTGELTANAACWALSGNIYANTEHGTDIVGMWEEPIKYRHINGKKFPEPLNKPPEIGDVYFIVNIEYGAIVLRLTWADSSVDNNRLKRGLIHASKEAAQAHADAINSLFRGESLD